MTSDIVKKCGEILDIDLQTIVATSRGRRSTVTLYDLIASIISTDSVESAAKSLNSSKTLMLGYCKEFLKPYFPDKKANENWSVLLLSATNNKYCNKCEKIKPIDMFSNRGLIKVSSCKACSAELASTCRENNGNSYNATSKVYYEHNKEEILSKHKEYRSNNIEYYREKSKSHYYANKSDYLAYNAKRRADKLLATPSWANLSIIKEIYKNAEGCHVDHIIPLNGTNVCGLHVENNLQYLTPEENMSKGNRFNIDLQV